MAPLILIMAKYHRLNEESLWVGIERVGEVVRFVRRFTCRKTMVSLHRGFASLCKAR